VVVSDESSPLQSGTLPRSGGRSYGGRAALRTPFEDETRSLPFQRRVSVGRPRVGELGFGKPSYGRSTKNEDESHLSRLSCRFMRATLWRAQLRGLAALCTPFEDGDESRLSRLSCRFMRATLWRAQLRGGAALRIPFEDE
jgi:hypothetical protein